MGAYTKVAARASAAVFDSLSVLEGAQASNESPRNVNRTDEIIGPPKREPA